MWREAFLFGVLFVNVYFFAVAISNVIYFRLATRTPRITGGPFVSIIVPARDEERGIARCVGSLLEQDYADYEVIVVDDQSSDATARTVRTFMPDSRLRLVTGTPLPVGWLGKQHAMAQGAQVARGEILMFTDADTVHSAQSVSWVVTNLQDHHADSISGYLKQETGTFGEMLVVPTQYAMVMFMPLALVPHSNAKSLSFSIGQMVAIRRAAFDGLHGFDSFSDSIVDDMSMAARLKGAGYRTIFLDAKRAASVRLYSSYRTAFNGTMRSIFGAVGGTTSTAVAMAAVVLGAIVYPAVAALWWPVSHVAPPVQLLVATVLFASQWGLTIVDRDAPIASVVLYPVVFADLVLLMMVSMVRTGYGRGVDWKGRLVRVGRRPPGEGASESDVTCELPDSSRDAEC
jgi:chlorobactene glucosyltransferase